MFSTAASHVAHPHGGRLVGDAVGVGVGKAVGGAVVGDRVGVSVGETRLSK